MTPPNPPTSRTTNQTRAAQAKTTPSESISPISWQDEEIHPGYFISTDHSLLDLVAINNALEDEDVYWTSRMEEGRLRRMLDLSLCFGVYYTPPPPPSPPPPPPTPSNPSSPPSNPFSPEERSQTRQQPTQIGLARLVTDTFSFAYLTDVYILLPHRNKGLATWMMRCVTEVLTSWPDLRRVALFASGEVARRFYVEGMGMESFRAGGEEKADEEEEEEEEHVVEEGQRRRRRAAGADGIEFLMLPKRQDIRGLELLVRDGAWTSSSGRE